MDMGGGGVKRPIGKNTNILTAVISGLWVVPNFEEKYLNTNE